MLYPFYKEFSGTGGTSIEEEDKDPPEYFLDGGKETGKKKVSREEKKEFLFKCFGG